MRQVLRVAAVLALALIVSGCAGYRAASDADAPFRIPEEFRDMHIRTVKNPTMDPDLEARLRTALRDELTRRGRAMWVPRERATALVDVTVHQFTTHTSLTGTDDETIRSSASISLTVSIVRRSDGSRLWVADHVGHSESFYGDDQEQAEASVLDLAVRKVVDRMTQSY